MDNYDEMAQVLEDVRKKFYKPTTTRCGGCGMKRNAPTPHTPECLLPRITKVLTNYVQGA